MVAKFKQFLHKLLRIVGIDIIRWYKIPENTLLGLTRLEISTILDIGANIGQSSQYYRRIFPKAQIYSFEPLPAVFTQLDTWAQTQNGKVRAINVAVGDRNGLMTMKEHVDFSPSSSFLERTSHSTVLFPQTTSQKEIQVTMVRLDDIVDTVELHPDILVKMDVQGYEDRVINGGESVLRQAVACIMEVSLQPLYAGQPTFKDLCFLMGDLGFEYAGNIQQIYDEFGRVIYLDALFTKPIIQ